VDGEGRPLRERFMEILISSHYWEGPEVAAVKVVAAAVVVPY
jgi:hypothetical protein